MVTELGDRPGFEPGISRKNLRVKVTTLNNCVLMRNWRPPQVTAEDDCAEYHQIVMPQSYRPEILIMCCCNSIYRIDCMSTIHTTIWQSINYWPRMKGYVVKFCYDSVTRVK